jgi:hypothetical protein
MISVVNVKKESCTHYCGRASSFIPTQHGVDLTLLGNPFNLKEYTRDVSIDMYGEYIWKRYMMDDPVIMKAINTLYDFKK